MTDDVLQQSRHTHSILTDFAGELVEHLSQLTTDEYRLAVFNLVGSHKGVAVLLYQHLIRLHKTLGKL